MNGKNFECRLSSAHAVPLLNPSNGLDNILPAGRFPDVPHWEIQSSGSVPQSILPSSRNVVLSSDRPLFLVSSSLSMLASCLIVPGKPKVFGMKWRGETASNMNQKSLQNLRNHLLIPAKESHLNACLRQWLDLAAHFHFFAMDFSSFPSSIFGSIL